MTVGSRAELPMDEGHNIYCDVKSQSDLERTVIYILTNIRHDMDKAKSRPDLTELYRRAGYLITFTDAPSWQEKFGNKAKAHRYVGEKEFQKAARKINRRAAQIGTDADYDETLCR
jgi:hypothetical protein